MSIKLSSEIEGWKQISNDEFSYVAPPYKFTIKCVYEVSVEGSPKCQTFQTFEEAKNNVSQQVSFLNKNRTPTQNKLVDNRFVRRFETYPY